MLHPCACIIRDLISYINLTLEAVLTPILPNEESQGTIQGAHYEV